MSDSGKRARPRQARSEKTVQAILDAADAVFAEVAVEVATTTQIAKRAGVSVGALYRFYDDKTAIAEALVDRYAVLLSAVVIDVEALLVERGTDALREALATVVRGIADLCRQQPGYFAVMRHLRDNRMQEVQIETLARWFEIASLELDISDRHRLAIFVSEVTRSLIERAPATGIRRQRHLDEIVELLVPYVERKLVG